jgi:hypothetical protein
MNPITVKTSGYDPDGPPVFDMTLEPKRVADAFEKAREIATCVKLEKLASSTNLVDVKNAVNEMPDDIFDAVKKNRTFIGKLWRARVGRTFRWSYAWNPVEALERAMKRAR